MADKTVTLRNLSRNETFQAVLYHSVICVKRGMCLCDTGTRRGASGIDEPCRTERSFTLLPRATSEPLPEEVLDIPQVKVGLSAKVKRLIIVEPKVRVERVEP